MAKPRLDDPLTAEQLRAVLDYIPATGAFFRHTKPDKPAGTTKSLNGYIYISINRRLYLAHRLAFLWMTGAWVAEVDHIDGDRKNNAWSNLREATRSQNNMNAKLRKTNTSGTKGIYWHKLARKWQVEIVVGGVWYNLGLHESLEDAKAARTIGEQHLHGKYARR